MYIHDLPGSAATKFIYADDKAYAYQARSLRTISRVLTRDLKLYTEYCRYWRLVPSESKTVTWSFHLDNGQANAELEVTMNEQPVCHDVNPKYLGVTLDCSLTYRKHLANVTAKVNTRNNIIQKLCHTTWGADAS